MIADRYVTHLPIEAQNPPVSALPALTDDKRASLADGRRQREATAAVLAIVPKDVCRGGVGVEVDSVIHGYGHDAADALLDLVAVPGDQLGLDINVSCGRRAS